MPLLHRKNLWKGQVKNSHYAMNLGLNYIDINWNQHTYSEKIMQEYSQTEIGWTYI